MLARFASSQIDCADAATHTCPTALGYGLGWAITQFEQPEQRPMEQKLIGHRGVNWHAVTLAYYYPSSGDGLVILLNGSTSSAMASMVQILELLDADSPELPGYILRAARYQ